MPLLRRRGRPPKDVPVQAIDESLSLFRINLTGAARKYLRAARCTQCPEVELVHAARAEIWVGLRQGIEPTKDGIRASIGRAFRDVHSKHASAAHEHDVEKVAAVQPELPAPADVEQLDDEKYATRQLAAFIEEVDQDNIAVLLMAVCKYKGLPQTRISKIVGLSEGRVSQVLADLRTQLTGKRRRQLLKRLSAVLVGWRTNLADDVLVHASSLAAKPSIKKPGRSWTPLSTGLAVGGFLGALAVIGFLSFGQSPGPQQVDAAESGDPGPETPHEAVANPDTLRLATTSDSPEPKYREVTSFQEPEGKGFLRPADIAAIEGVVDTFAREYAKVPTTDGQAPSLFATDAALAAKFETLASSIEQLRLAAIPDHAKSMTNLNGPKENSPWLLVHESIHEFPSKWNPSGDVPGEQPVPMLDTKVVDQHRVIAAHSIMKSHEFLILFLTSDDGDPRLRIMMGVFTEAHALLVECPGHVSRGLYWWSISPDFILGGSIAMERHSWVPYERTVVRELSSQGRNIPFYLKATGAGMRIGAGDTIEDVSIFQERSSLGIHGYEDLPFPMIFVRPKDRALTHESLHSAPGGSVATQYFSMWNLGGSTLALGCLEDAIYYYGVKTVDGYAGRVLWSARYFRHRASGITDIFDIGAWHLTKPPDDIEK